MLFLTQIVAQTGSNKKIFFALTREIPHPPSPVGPAPACAGDTPRASARIFLHDRIFFCTRRLVKSPFLIETRTIFVKKTGRRFFSTPFLGLDRGLNYCWAPLSQRTSYLIVRTDSHNSRSCSLAIDDLQGMHSLYSSVGRACAS